MLDKVIKICINPHCDAVAHNCDRKETPCRDCGFRLVKINIATYLKKFRDNYFQYNYDNNALLTSLEIRGINSVWN